MFCLLCRELNRNILDGDISGLFKLANLKILFVSKIKCSDLSDNKLSGELPANLSHSSSLEGLFVSFNFRNLKGNDYNGTITESMCELTKFYTLFGIQ